MSRSFFVVATAVATLFLARPALSEPATPLAAGVKTTTDFRDLGRAPAALPVRIAVTLQYRNESALDSLIDMQSDPDSPLFHHFLTNAQFNAAFAPSSDQYAFVSNALRRAGFQVVQTFPNRTIVDATGSRAAAERYFATEIHTGVQTGHGVRFKNVTPAILPRELRGLVVAVSGLDNLVMFKPRYVRGNPLHLDPDKVGPPLKGGSGNFGPLAYAQGYDEPVQHGFDGTGQTIGNAMAGNIQDSDLATYLAYFSITPKHSLMRVAVDGGNLLYFDVETTLDIESMQGTTPGAQVMLYSFPEFTDMDAEDTYNMVVSDNLVDALNSSWGGCELTGPPLGRAFARSSNRIFKQGAAKGIAFPVATGDYGAATCEGSSGILQQTTPDSDPYALAVGGTQLQVDSKGNWTGETGWDGSDGGISLLFKMPHYQNGVKNVDPSGRNLPDLALSGGDQSAFDEYLDGSWGAVWGTSLSSPLFTGLDGQLSQFQKGRIGFVNPSLYKDVQAKTYHKLFHDITSGNNGYPAGPGFDLVTGVGSPQGWALAHSKI